MNKEMQVLLTTKLDIARRLVSAGFEPVEVEEGDESLTGKLQLVHHGKYANSLPPCVKTQTEYFAKGEGFYVINHIDADVITAIAGLEGIKLDKKLVELIAEIDIHGKHATNWTQHIQYAARLMKFHRRVTEVYKKYSAEFKVMAVNITGDVVELIDILRSEIEENEAKEIVAQYEGLILKAVNEIVDTNGKVAFAIKNTDTESAGFEGYYRKAPIVIAYDRTKITIGVVSEEIAKKYFGQNGLLQIVPLLNEKFGAGWGGRSTIIGSPRDKVYNREEAEKVFQLIAEIVNGTVCNICGLSINCHENGINPHGTKCF